MDINTNIENTTKETGNVDSVSIVTDKHNSERVYIEEKEGDIIVHIWAFVSPDDEPSITIRFPK